MSSSSSSGSSSSYTRSGSSSSIALQSSSVLGKRKAETKVDKMDKKAHGDEFKTTFSTIDSPPYFHSVIMFSSFKSKLLKTRIFPDEQKKLDWILKRITTFNTCRALPEWHWQEINIFVRTLASLFTKDGLRSLCVKYFEGELKKNASKNDYITELIRTPLWLEWDVEGQVPKIIFDAGKYGIDPPAYIPPVSSLRKKQRKVQEGKESERGKADEEQPPPDPEILESEQEEDIEDGKWGDEDESLFDNNLEAERKREKDDESEDIRPKSTVRFMRTFMKEFCAEFLNTLQKANLKGKSSRDKGEESDDTPEIKKAKKSSSPR